MAEDKAQAVEWYTRAAEGGYAPAQTNLAVCLLNGTGAERSAEEAVGWLEKAAEQEFPRAQGILGDLLLTGNGVPRTRPGPWSSTGPPPRAAMCRHVRPGAVL